MSTTEKSKWKILFVILLGPFMATLDSSIVNVALPNMAKGLNVGISDIQWVVTSYLIVISSTILIFGRLGDLKGKGQVFHYGFLTFSIGSLLCGLSRTLILLVLSRVFQAIGAAMIMACSQGIITDTFPPNQRGRALGLSGTTVALGTMIGPPLGGVMVGLFNWQSIFLINVPIGIVAFFLGRRILSNKNREKNKYEFDLLGGITFAGAIVTLFWPMLSGEVIGWTDIRIIISFIISIILFIIFYSIEKSKKEPMVDFAIFHNRLFTVSIICAFISFMVLFCTNITHPFYLQYILGLSPEKSGILMAAYPISIAIAAPMSGYFSDKLGGEKLTLFGLIVTLAGIFSLAFLNQHSSYLDVVLRISVMGFGNGFFQSPNNVIVMSTVPKDKLGIAGGINALVRNLGMVFGIAISVVLLYNRMSAKVGYKVSGYVKERPDAFIYGMKFVYITGSIILLIGIILTALRLMERKS